MVGGHQVSPAYCAGTKQIQRDKVWLSLLGQKPVLDHQVFHRGHQQRRQLERRLVSRELLLKYFSLHTYLLNPLAPQALALALGVNSRRPVRSRLIYGDDD